MVLSNYWSNLKNGKVDASSRHVIRENEAAASLQRLH